MNKAPVSDFLLCCFFFYGIRRNPIAGGQIRLIRKDARIIDSAIKYNSRLGFFYFVHMLRCVVFCLRRLAATTECVIIILVPMGRWMFYCLPLGVKLCIRTSRTYIQKKKPSIIYSWLVGEKSWQFFPKRSAKPSRSFFGSTAQESGHFRTFQPNICHVE